MAAALAAAAAKSWQRHQRKIIERAIVAGNQTRISIKK